MLTVGTVQGGPEVEHTPFCKFIMKLMDAADRTQTGFPFGSLMALNLVFHIPGSILSDLGYEGLRHAKFSRSQKMLMIQVAVPKEIAASHDMQTIRKYVLDCLREANSIAAAFLEKKRVEYSQASFLSLIKDLENIL